MSQNFCLLIPSKLFKIDKNISDKIQKWIKNNISEKFLPYYSLLDLKKFRIRQDVNLNIPLELYNRYHVLDFGFYFPEPELLGSLLSWLADIYSYGDVGLLVYWLDNRQRYPAITVDETGIIIRELSIKDLTLDKIFFLPLNKYKK